MFFVGCDQNTGNSDNQNSIIVEDAADLIKDSILTVIGGDEEKKADGYKFNIELGTSDPGVFTFTDIKLLPKK